MALKETQWRPDTCECVVRFAWNTDSTELERTHTFASVVAACPEHPALAGSALYDTVLAENRRKNQLLPIAQSVLATITDAHYRWSFSGSGSARVLNVSFAGITISGARKTQIQAICDTQFGPGTVVVS